MTKFAKQVETVVQPGGPAGDHQVHQKFFATEDRLISVHHIDDEDLGTNGDLTSEFTVVDNGVINNVGGTNTSGDYLVITWLRMK